MKKILLVGIILGITMMFIGCGNSVAKKSIEQAKISMENKEYDKTILLLEMALDEEKENEEATKLYEIVDKYQKANKSMQENNIEEANKFLGSIKNDYTSYSIKDDIDGLKKEVEDNYKEIEKVNKYLAEAEKLFDENKYKGCKMYLGANILGSKEDGIEANKYATEEQKQRASELLDKCEGIIEKEKIKKKDVVESNKNNTKIKLSEVVDYVSKYKRPDETVNSVVDNGRIYKGYEIGAPQEEANNDFYALVVSDSKTADTGYYINIKNRNLYNRRWEKVN
ncbi:hypothetical protein P5E75_10540 [Clostridium perfringens]|nr:hypothetical protein [Clostridium perfringens]